MCVAGLNISTQACAHRWYELIRPCSPANNLQNCPARLRLEGWERRQESCPFCDGTAGHHHSTHRLFGSTSAASSVTSSPTLSEMAVNRCSRQGSGATLTGPLSPLSRESSNCSIELDRATRARDMNDRIHLYLSSDPHQILPSAMKNYPSYSAAIARAEEAAANDDDSSKKHGQSHSINTVSRGWRRMSKRFSLGSDLFKLL